jgi:branched-chain amino acid transport system substrate-binding protein
MVCCLNPDCSNPINPDGTIFCASCGIHLVSLLRGRYRIVKPLGGGGFARTYLAEDIDKLSELCVVKQLAPQLQGSWSHKKAVELFEQEAKRLQQLGEHPQIPTLYAYFKEGDYLYLVQQFIAGQNLLQELQQQGVFNEAKIRGLLSDLLPIVSMLHQQQVIHRDIKPENIIRRESDGKLVLIDFGVSKHKTGTVNANPGTNIGSFGYASLEQLHGGEAYPASDLYSLGVTCFFLLTYVLPSELWMKQGYSWTVDWGRHVTQQISPQLSQIIDKLLQPNYEHRYHSADAVLQDLNTPVPYTIVSPSTNQQAKHGQLWPPPNIRLFLSLGLSGVIISAIFVLFNIFNQPTLSPQNRQTATISPGPSPTSDNMSLGEEVFITKNSPPEKEAGRLAFASGDFSAAVEKFNSSLDKNPNDPETLIYLNNAIAELNKKKSNLLRVAVIVRISGNVAQAEEILRGVAQAQDEVNNSREKINDAWLQLQIVKIDSRNSEITDQVNRKLVDDPSILAVVGFIPDVSIYNKYGLVMVSPINPKINPKPSESSQFVFYATPSQDVFSDKLAEYIVQEASIKKIAVCEDSSFGGRNENSKEETSSGITPVINQYKESIKKYGGNVTNTDCDFGDNNFQATNVMSRAISDGAEGLLLFPTRDNISKSNSTVFQLLEANQGRLPLFGFPTMYSETTLRFGKQNVKGTVLPLPWHRDANPDISFSTKAAKLWKAEVSPQTGVAYDALKAIIAGLEKSNTRSGLQQALSNPNYIAYGAGGKIKFSPATGIREGEDSVFLVEINSCQPSTTKGCSADSLLYFQLLER